MTAPAAPTYPTPSVGSYAPPASPPPPTSDTPTASPGALPGVGGLDGFSIIANGNNIVIANNGSIVSVGDNTVLTANTGDAGASSIIALDVAGSAVTSGSSTASGWTNGSSQPPPGSPTNAPGSPSTAATASAPDGGAPGTRAVAIAGYQDTTLEVVGNDNLLTSNDSNLFFNRAGHLNANTGDTDMSALNVVDATGSLVRSGNSSAPAGPAPVGQASTASATAVAGAAPPGAATSVVGPDGTATATGADALAIGGPGVVDASVDMYGDRNVTTIDDGNVTVGGAGDVNAQIGDSDTSGAVVMDVTDSAITTGNSGPAAAVLTPSDITTSDQP